MGNLSRYIIRAPPTRNGCRISQGKRKETKDDGVSCTLETDRSSKEYRKNWALVIRKIRACPRLDRGKAFPGLARMSLIDD